MANPNAAPGLWGQVYVNGIDVTNQVHTIGYDWTFMPLATLVQNTGLHTYITGAEDPMMQLDGFRKSATTATTLFDLIRSQGATRATDTEFIVAAELGYGASPADGDRALLFDGTLTQGPGSDMKPEGLYTLPAKFEGRGNYCQPGNRIYAFSGTATATSAFFDSNPNGYTLPTLGAICLAEITTATVSETLTVTMTSATSSGGSYSTFGTFVLNGQTVGGEWLEIASGTTINRYIKCTVTKSGSSENAAGRFYFARKWR